MREYKENIKTLSEDEVIHLSNQLKRQEFIKNYRDWGVWLEIPEIKVNVYKAKLPNGNVIFITEYLEIYNKRINPVYSSRLGRSADDYSRYPSGDFTVIEALKDLKVNLCNERRTRR